MWATITGLFVSLTQDRVILGKEPLIEKMPLLDWPVVKLVIHFY